MTIVDTNQNSTPRLSTLKASGIDRLGRYISAGMTAKVIRPAEARAIAAAGMRLFLIYETDGKPAGATIGARDGTFAVNYAKSIGAPAGALIYYTVDFDAGPNDLPGISQAFSAFKAALGGTYRVGAYANGFVCASLFKAGLIEKRWLTCSLGFNGTRAAIAAGAYDMLQLLPRQTAGLDTDPDTLHVANGDIGDFVPFAVSPTIAPDVPRPVVAKPSDGWLSGILKKIAGV